MTVKFLRCRGSAQRSGARLHGTQSADGVFAVSGDTRTNQTLWPVLNACEDLKVLVIEVSFPDETGRTRGNVPGTIRRPRSARTCKRLEKDPQIWLTGMKPGEESRIFEQVIRAAPGRSVQMLSRGTILTI